MEIWLKNTPVLLIEPDGTCRILDFDRLPFGLRREKLFYPDFYEWASNRSLSIGRSHAKEILNAFRLSQTSRFEVCMACRGLSLQDAYWIRQADDLTRWEDVSLFTHPPSLYIAGISLSGDASLYPLGVHRPSPVHTPELTTLGVNAKGWFREDGIHYLYKIGKNELAAARILQALDFPHLTYTYVDENAREKYLTPARRDWLRSTGEELVRSALFTGPDRCMVTFEEFRTFCDHYGLNAYEQAVKIDEKAWLQMQVADYILNNSDRHEQNWGFFMDPDTGKISGYCPLFDHDRSFSMQEGLLSQTTQDYITLEAAGMAAQRQLKADMGPLLEMSCPAFLDEQRWEAVLNRCRKLDLLSHSH
ncbi:MAG: hypothetical protein IKE03_01895 [Blautia sp.]|nr:hypothetical protein [Blautia sp.]